MFPTRSAIAALLLACAPLAMAQPPERGMRGGDPGVMLENRIAEMHDAIGITAAQEQAWGQVTQIMRDNEKVMRDAMRAVMGPNRPQSAPDMLKAAADMAATHAQGARRLADAFAGFYGQLNADQKKAADQQFSEQGPRGPMGRDRSR